VASEGVEEKQEGIKTMLQDICESTLGLENSNKKRVDIRQHMEDDREKESNEG
jgi:hypothetical protein